MSPVGNPRQPRLDLGRPLRRHGLGAAQIQRERDQALLYAIVEIALETPPRVVRRRHDARPRGGHLGARLGVRDRRRDQLGECRDPRLGARWKRILLPRRCDHHSPQAPLDHDRGTDRRPDPQARRSISAIEPTASS